MRRLTARQASEREAKRAYPSGSTKLLTTVVAWVLVTYLIATWANSFLGGAVWVAICYGVANWTLGGTPFEDVNQFIWLSNYFSHNLTGWNEVFWLGPNGHGRGFVRPGCRFRKGYTVIEIPLGGWKNEPRGQTADRESSRWRVEIPADCYPPFILEGGEVRLPEVRLIDADDSTIMYRLSIDRALEHLAYSREGVRQSCA